MTYEQSQFLASLKKKHGADLAAGVRTDLSCASPEMRARALQAVQAMKERAPRCPSGEAEAKLCRAQFRARRVKEIDTLQRIYSLGACQTTKNDTP